MIKIRLLLNQYDLVLVFPLKLVSPLLAFLNCHKRPSLCCMQLQSNQLKEPLDLGNTPCLLHDDVWQMTISNMMVENLPADLKIPKSESYLFTLAGLCALCLHISGFLFSLWQDVYPDMVFLIFTLYCTFLVSSRKGKSHILQYLLKGSS